MHQRIAQLLAERLGHKTPTEFAALLEVPPQNSLGDYALPCFSFAKDLKKAPPAIAQELTKKVAGGLIARAEAVGPYLNLFLDREHVTREVLGKIFKEKERYGHGKRTEKVMIEYSQPNTHKAFHVGHVRGTAMGEALARILRHAGCEVVQTNYSGDTGMHVAKWLWCYTTFHAGERPPKEKNQLGKWLASFYVEAVRRLSEQPELQATVDEINRKLDEGKDAELVRIWQETRQW